MQSEHGWYHVSCVSVPQEVDDCRVALSKLLAIATLALVLLIVGSMKHYKTYCVENTSYRNPSCPRGTTYGDTRCLHGGTTYRNIYGLGGTIMLHDRPTLCVECIA